MTSEEATNPLEVSGTHKFSQTLWLLRQVSCPNEGLTEKQIQAAICWWSTLIRSDAFSIDATQGGYSEYIAMRRNHLSELRQLDQIDPGWTIFFEMAFAEQLRRNKYQSGHCIISKDYSSHNLDGILTKVIQRMENRINNLSNDSDKIKKNSPNFSIQKDDFFPVGDIEMKFASNDLLIINGKSYAATLILEEYYLKFIFEPYQKKMMS